jgi:hypothetical protein
MVSNWLWVILLSVTMCLLFFALIRAMVSPCFQFDYLNFLACNSWWSQSFDWQVFSFLCYIFAWNFFWQYHFVNFQWKLNVWTISVSYLSSIFIFAFCAFYWKSHKLYMYCFPSLEACSWRRIQETKRIKFNFFIKQLCVIVKGQLCCPKQFHDTIPLKLLKWAAGEGDHGISVGDIKHPEWALFGASFGSFLGVLHGYVLFAACVPHHKNNKIKTCLTNFKN